MKSNCIKDMRTLKTLAALAAILALAAGGVWAKETAQTQTVEMERLELQLCAIHGVLRETYHARPFYDKEDPGGELQTAFEARLDSLQSEFRTVLERICRMDSAMEYDFPHLNGLAGVEIATSPDSKLRVFSRDTHQGGTMPIVHSYVQFKTGGTGGGFACFDGVEDKRSGYYYDSIHVLGTGGPPVYILEGRSSASSLHLIYLVRAVSIVADKIEDIDVFQKMDDSPESELVDGHDIGNVEIADKRLYPGGGNFPRIVFDSDERVILVPETDESLELTGRVVTYKWDENADEKRGEAGQNRNVGRFVKQPAAPANEIN